MKKKIFMFFLVVVACCTTLNAQTLDLAIMGAAAKISRDLPSGASVAVINFHSDSENFNEYVLNELYGAILRNRSVIPVQLNVKQFQTIRSGLNTDGELNSETAQSIGKLLGVQYLITGSIKQIGALYNIVFNAVDLKVELQSQYQASLNPRNDTQFASLLSGKSQPSAGSGSSSQQKPVTKEKKPVNPEDTKLWTIGASLGIAFYDNDFDDNTFWPGTIHGTLAPFKYSFFELGVEMLLPGFFPELFANFALFLPFPRTEQEKRWGGWYAGMGIIFWGMNEPYMNFITGFNILDMLDISYTIHLGYSYIINKLSVGYVYRFK